MNTSTHGSTGPRTPEGKAISSKNALKHGFTSRDLVIPDHLKEDFDQLQSRLLSEFQIASELQNQCFRQYLRASWNLFRLDLEEARLFNEKGIDALLDTQHAHLQRYRRQQERSRNEALAELRRLVRDFRAADLQAAQEKQEEYLRQVQAERVRLEEQAERFRREASSPPIDQAA
jgi:hypothetical protein